MPSQLAPDQMSDSALWRRVFALVARARPSINTGPQDLEVALDQLEACLQELQARGQQLSLLPEQQRLWDPEAS
jgi:hypothetical protein